MFFDIKYVTVVYISEIFNYFLKDFQDTSMVGSCSAFGCKNRATKHQKLLFHKFPLNDPKRLQKWLKAIKRESWQPTKHSFLCSQHFSPDSYKSNPKHFLKDDAVPSIACFSTDHPKIVRNKTVEDSLPMLIKSPVVVLQRNISSEEFSGVNYNFKPSFGTHNNKLLKSREISSNNSSFETQNNKLQKSREISSNNSSFETQNNKLQKSREISSNNSFFETSELEIYKDSVCARNLIASDDETNDVSDIEFSDSEDTKQRLDIMTVHYKKARKKLKMCQQRCSLYKKEITALKEVINSLREINSVIDDN